MNKIQISKQMATRLMIRSQLLNGNNALLPAGKEGVLQTIEKLGYLQIDTISVIQRTHHHTLWTRRPDYEPDMLHELQAKDRRLFEYYARVSSYLPMQDYRFYMYRMNNYDDPVNKWEKDRLAKYGYLMEPVLERIRNEGPLSSKDFESLPESERNDTFFWKPAKMALDLLVLKGELMIKERRNFQKVFDLTERVLPENINTTLPDEKEVGHFFVKRALAALAVAREKEIYDFIQIAGKKLIFFSLKELIETGDVVEVDVKQSNHNIYYALSETVKVLDSDNFDQRIMHFLSPFDNLIIQRDRINQFFSFNYSLECYVKPEKREFGYFVLPILSGDRFIGRMDPAVDKKKKILVLKGLFFEPDVRDIDSFLPLFAGKLIGFARFNKCNTITAENIQPAGLRKPFRDLLDKINPIY